jgi:hypothetical protein
MLFKINKDARLFLSGRRMKNTCEKLQRQVPGTDR